MLENAPALEFWRADDTVERIQGWFIASDENFELLFSKIEEF